MPSIKILALKEYACRDVYEEAYRRDAVANLHTQSPDTMLLYDYEWLRHKQVFMQMLAHRCNNDVPRVYARKCKVVKVEAPVATTFYDQYHIQGGNGGGVYYGLTYEDALVACMRFTHGGNDRGIAAKNREWTLSRYATSVSVVGGASKLMRHFIAQHQPPLIKSFSDNRMFGGGLYEKLGFALTECIPRDYQVFHPSTGMVHKAYWQKRNIPKILHKIGAKIQPNMAQTEKQITYEAGAWRVFDAGKKKWVWQPS